MSILCMPSTSFCISISTGHPEVYVSVYLYRYIHAHTNTNTNTMLNNDHPSRERSSRRWRQKKSWRNLRYRHLGGKKKKGTAQKLNSEFTPEKWWDWKTILSYWVSVTFQGRTVKLRGSKPIWEALVFFHLHHPIWFFLYSWHLGTKAPNNDDGK